MAPKGMDSDGKREKRIANGLQFLACLEGDMLSSCNARFKMYRDSNEDFEHIVKLGSGVKSSTPKMDGSTTLPDGSAITGSYEMIFWLRVERSLPLEAT